MATPQVNRVQPPPAPVAMVTPAADASTNQNPIAQSRGAVTQEQASVSSSQQFIPPGIILYTLLQVHVVDVVRATRDLFRGWEFPIPCF